MLLTALLVAACGEATSPLSPDASTAAAGRPSGAGITMTDLGTLGGRWSAAYGINESGVIVGGSTTASGVAHAFVWSNGTMADLGSAAPGSSSVAHDINEAGVIVGTVVGTNGNQPVRWSPLAGGGYSPPEELGTLGGCCGEAYALNDGGQIIGDSRLLSQPAPEGGGPVGHAFLWQSGSMADIHPLTLFAESAGTVAWGINDAGTVVGQQYGPGRARAFVRDANGEAQLLPGIGGSEAIPLDINAEGAIVGWSQASPTDQWLLHATLWVAGIPQDLGTLGGVSSVAIAITDEAAPRVVGRADTRRGHRAFVWTAAGGMKDLGLPKGRSSGQAWDLNRNGWVVGETSATSGRTYATLWKLPAD
jgi:probable HAF family extracellular repeat protein